MRCQCVSISLKYLSTFTKVLAGDPLLILHRPIFMPEKIRINPSDYTKQVSLVILQVHLVVGSIFLGSLLIRYSTKTFSLQFFVNMCIQSLTSREEGEDQNLLIEKKKKEKKRMTDGGWGKREEESAKSPPTGWEMGT